MLLDCREVELAAGRCVDFEDFQYLIREVAQRMRHAGRYENDLIGSDRVRYAVSSEGSLAPTHNIDIIGP